MIKQVPLLAAMLFVSAMSFSQGFVTFSIGASNPTGDFGDTDINNDKAGGAKPGVNGDLSLGRLFWKKFGLVSSVRYMVNDFDVDQSKILVANGKNNISLTSKGYKTFMILIGPYYEFSLGQRYKLDLKVQAGFFDSKFPETRVNNNANNNGTVVTGAGSATIATLAGVNLRRDVGKHFALALTFDYLIATESYIINYDTYVSNQNSNHIEDKIDQTFSSLNAMLGFAYKFK